KLSQQPFACEEDAQSEAERWIKKQPLLKFDFQSIESREGPVSGKRGRPKKDEVRVLSKKYFIVADIILNDEAVARERRSLGRFILATNDLSISPENILKWYKEQSQVERGFRFLKSSDFRISEIFLKNPRRIQGLCCLMGMLLLIYIVLQIKLHIGLKKIMKIFFYSQKN
ncbi:MAG: IS1634 family transposase, partial [Deltaproteobacteria bacterium]|nr:IS1634 family transposase [Deltaproteobacteria bacterium]